MPIYEYWCHNCQRKAVLYRASFSEVTPLCPRCNDNSLTRLFSTFLVRKTDKAIYEDILSDSQLVKGMRRNDPKALAEWNRRMSRGEKSTPEYEDMVQEMEKGEIPVVTNKKTESA